MKFRDANIDDLPRIVEIYNSTVAGRMVTADTEPVSVSSRLHWFNDHSSHKRPLWVIESEANDIIGWVSFQSFYGRPAYDATAEISIYLDASVRGNGVGKKVLDHAIQSCGSLRIKTILGYIFSHNEPSIKLFESFGFKVWGVFPNIAVLDGVERSVTVVGKRLTN
jgi:L-amino acid N-acyltransferase YncA